MSLTLDDNHSHYQIRAFKPGHIQVNEMLFNQSLIISSDTLITDWQPQFITDLTALDLQAILPLKPAVLLIGTGATLIFPKLEVYGELLNHGIGVEIMDTRAACHTFNALTSENRHVVAALFVKI